MFCEIQDGWEDLDTERRAGVMSRQGVPFVHATHLRVVDEEMRTCPRTPSAMGEVVMRGNNVMRGYYQDPEATAEAFRGGWFHSGDVGVMHPDGYIELRDRSKDVIISRRREHLHDRGGEHPLRNTPTFSRWRSSVSRTRSGARSRRRSSRRSPAARRAPTTIVAFARERLAHFKCPKSVEFGELPKTATGKIQKFKLREKEWAGRERHIQG